MAAITELQGDILKKVNDRLDVFSTRMYAGANQELLEIFQYHLGLTDPIGKQGKRIRPLLTLISARGAGIDPDLALPAAVSIELVHNFSLIHDDIEDNGITRRGKETVWKKWGLALGLNAGDAMFNAAFISLFELRENFSDRTVLQALELLTDTCDALTRGQHLDIGFETKDEVQVDEYHRMIVGKTAALLSCCTEMGALLGGLSAEEIGDFRRFGFSLGIAFQMYDDWLGIWGQQDKVGKSTSGDLIERKKTLPILLGLSSSERFRAVFRKNEFTPEDINSMADILREDGIESQVRYLFTQHTDAALNHLKKMVCGKTEKAFLEQITTQLINRVK